MFKSFHMARLQYISPTTGEFPLIAFTPWNARATAIQFPDPLI